MSEQWFWGAWRLISQVSIAADGMQKPPRGPNPHGIIMYDQSGWMSVFLARAALDPAARIGDFSTALHETLAYYGRYEVDTENGTVTHHLSGCTYPGWIGTDQVRAYTFDGDRLTLTAKTTDERGDQVTRVLVWERQV